MSTTDNNNRQDINALREHLFATIQAVKAGQMPLDTARAVNELAKTLVDTARVEVDFIRATDGDASSTFLKAPQDPAAPALPNGIVGITRHVLQG